MSTQLSEVDGGPLEVKQSLFEHFEEGLNNSTDDPAVIVMFQSAGHLSELKAATTAEFGSLRNGVSVTEHAANENKQHNFLSWTYRELHLASVRFANALVRAGVQSENAKIISLIPNGIEYPLLIWTATLARLTLCNLDLGALQPKRQPELQNFLESLSADVILVPDVAGAKAVDATSSTLSLPQPKVKLIVPAANTDAEVIPGWQNLSDFVMEGAYPPLKNDTDLRSEAKSVDPHHAALILFTSGTSSGKPKGCIREVSHLCHSLPGQKWITPSGRSSRAFIAGANFRAMSHFFTIQTWAAGGAVVLPFLTFDPKTTLQAIQEHRVDSLIMVPYHFHAIVDHPTFRSTDVSSLRLVACGGDMVTKDLLMKLKTAFPDAEQVRVGHGMTEGGALFSWPFGRDMTNLPYFGGIAPLGKADAGARMRIVDKNTGKVTKRGEPGELHISSGSFSTAYLGGIKQEDWYVDDKGKWFMTGDLGMIAEEGSIYILGRIKDVIKRAGVPITPAAIENCIEKQTKCACSVIGIPHPKLGSEPFAIVQNFDLADESCIKQSVVDEFGKDYSLAGVVSLQQLGLKQFPLNATAKIMKVELEQPVLQYLDTRSL